MPTQSRRSLFAGKAVFGVLEMLLVTVLELACVPVLGRVHGYTEAFPTEQLGGVAFDLHIPQPGGQHCHHHRHQNGFNDGQAVKQGAVTVGKLLRVCRGKTAHP